MASDSFDEALGKFAAAMRRARLRTEGSLRDIEVRSGVSKSVWSSTLNGKSFPEESNWRKMVEFFSDEGLGAAAADLKDLYKAAETKRGKTSGPSRAKRRTRTARLHLSSLENITAFELPVVDRIGLVPDDLHRPRADSRTVTFLIGEGGLGKSVLLKQLAKKLAAAPGEEDRGAVVGVACNRVSGASDLSTVHSADVALARAAGVPDPSAGLTGLVRRLRGEFGSVHLLIDTVDLIVDDLTAPALTGLLRTLSDEAQLFVTCRKQEYKDHLEPNSTGPWHGPGARYTPINMPELSAPEIVDWAERYVDRLQRTETQRARFLESLTDGVKSRTMKQVCVVPLRLALACVLYSDGETVPADLTITGLYEEYWERRIVCDQEGRRTADAESQESGAFALAEEILRHSDKRPSLSVIMAGTEHGKGLKALQSEGIVQGGSGHYEFFHQTYAEFAVAKLLAFRGKPEQLDRLRRELDDPASHWWPVAHHLLLQRRPTQTRYEDLLETVPLLSGEGPRIHVLSAQTRTLPGRLKTVAKSIEESSEAELHSLMPQFAEAPAACAEVVLEFSIPHLETCENNVITEIGRTVGILLPKLETISPVSQLSLALEKVDDRTGEMPNDLRTGLEAHLIKPSCESAFDPALFKLLCKSYGRFGSSGQIIVLRTALEHKESSPELIETLAGPMLASPRPENLDETEYVELLHWCWENTQVRNLREWGQWSDMLDADLPERWDSAQIRLVVKLCGDPDTRRHLLEEQLSEVERKHQRRWIDVALFVAEADPKAVYTLLKGRSWPVGRIAVGSAAALAEQIAKHLDETERRELSAALRPLADIEARKVWPKLIVLAGPYLALHDGLLSDFVEFDSVRSNDDETAQTWKSDRVSPINTWLNDAPAEFLMDRREVFRSLLPASGREFTQRRAHFEGRIALLDGDARDWLTEQALHGPSAKAAYKGVQAAVFPIEEGCPTVNLEVYEWVSLLLESRHSEVVVKLAWLLSQPDLTPGTVFTSPVTGPLKVDGVERRFVDALLPIAADRLMTARDKRGKTEVIRGLISLLIRIGGDMLLDVDLIRAIVQKMSELFLVGARSPVLDGEKPECAAIFNLWCVAIVKLALPRMPIAEVKADVESVLLAWDGADLGTTSNRGQAADVIRGVLGKSPEFGPWMTGELWPVSSRSTKRAVAEAAVLHDQRVAGHLALTLSQRTDCPPDVRNWIRSRLQR